MLNPSICFSAFGMTFQRDIQEKAKNAIDDAIFRLKEELGNTTKRDSKNRNSLL